MASLKGGSCLLFFLCCSSGKGGCLNEIAACIMGIKMFMLSMEIKECCYEDFNAYYKGRLLEI